MNSYIQKINNINDTTKDIVFHKNTPQKFIDEFQPYKDIYYKITDKQIRDVANNYEYKYNVEYEVVPIGKDSIILIKENARKKYYIICDNPNLAGNYSMKGFLNILNSPYMEFVIP